MSILDTPSALDEPQVEDIEVFDRDEHYEIVDGEEKELPPMSADSQWLASRLVRIVGSYGVDRNLGEACSEVLFHLPLPVDRNRRPDVAFISYKAWPKNRPAPSTNTWNVLPEICVEITSPSDSADELRTKVKEYLDSGVRLVWVVYPRARLIDVYEPTGKNMALTDTDELTAGDVLPGFTLKLSEFFPTSTTGDAPSTPSAE